MKAPDKIYVPQHNIEAGTIQELNELIVADSTEYIRKDALLEWANNMLSLRRDTGDDYFYPAIVVLNDLIDKLNSM